jgi:two-component system, NtrC family, response regulator AtoC
LPLGCCSVQAIEDMSDHLRTVELALEGGFVPGRARSVESLNATVLEIARTDIPVLILGESGTGKEVYAKLLHRLSDCSDTPLKKVNCSLLNPTQLLEQLHTHHPEISAPRVAQSLFLDGIDELESSCQRALLSLLSDNEGQQGTPGPGTRLISSSSQDLEDAVKAGHFRKELYFRINGVCLRLPPLRERKEDIPALLEHFLRKHARALLKATPPLNQETIEALTNYDWPGNIRELENLARNIVALGNVDLALHEIRNSRTDSVPPSRMEQSFSLKNAARAASRQRERELILEALERTKWNRKRAARELQISYKALLYKLKQIGSSETETQK